MFTVLPYLTRVPVHKCTGIHSFELSKSLSRENLSSRTQLSSLRTTNDQNGVPCLSGSLLTGASKIEHCCASRTLIGTPKRACCLRDLYAGPPTQNLRAVSEGVELAHLGRRAVASFSSALPRAVVQEVEVLVGWLDRVCEAIRQKARNGRGTHSNDRNRKRGTGEKIDYLPASGSGSRSSSTALMYCTVS